MTTEELIHYFKTNADANNPAFEQTYYPSGNYVIVAHQIDDQEVKNYVSKRVSIFLKLRYLNDIYYDKAIRYKENKFKIDEEKCTKNIKLFINPEHDKTIIKFFGIELDLYDFDNYKKSVHEKLKDIRKLLDRNIDAILTALGSALTDKDTLEEAIKLLGLEEDD